MIFFKYISFLILGFLLIVSSEGFSQEIINKKNIMVEMVQLNQNSSNFLLDSNINGIIQTQVSISFINQLGNNNYVEVKSDNDDSQLVIQSGDNNYYQCLNYYNKKPLLYNIYQKGNANSLQIYGSNSIGKKMNILQKGNYKSIIIKNY